MGQDQSGRDQSLEDIGIRGQISLGWYLAQNHEGRVSRLLTGSYGGMLTYAKELRLPKPRLKSDLTSVRAPSSYRVSIPRRKSITPLGMKISNLRHHLTPLSLENLLDGHSRSQDIEPSLSTCRCAPPASCPWKLLLRGGGSPSVSGFVDDILFRDDTHSFRTFLKVFQKRSHSISKYGEWRVLMLGVAVSCVDDAHDFA